MHNAIILLMLLASTPILASDSPPNCDERRSDELTCAACNIYHEARGEGTDGMEAIAWVMMNRKNDPRFPETVCNVVWDQPYGRPEFAWTDDGLSDKITDPKSWERSKKIAHDLVVEASSDVDDPTKGAIFYRTTIGSDSKWWNSLLVTNEIGKHSFYVDGE